LKKAVFFLILVLLFTGCEGKREEKTKHIEKEKKSPVVAVVGSESITLEEFDKEFRDIRREYPEKITPALSLTLARIKKEFLESLIEEKFLLQLAKQKGVFLTDKELLAAVKRVTGEDLKQSKLLVESEGVLFSSWLKKVSNKAVANKLIEKDVYSKVHVSRIEMRRYFDSNFSTLVKKEVVYLLHIALETESEAIDVLRKLKKRGANFKKIAKSIPFLSVKLGRDLGYVERGKLPRKLDEAAFSLKKGEISDVLGSAYGFHILKCVDKIKSQQLLFEDAIPIIKARMEKKKREAVYSEWIKEKHKEIKIVIYPHFLKSIRKKIPVPFVQSLS